MKTLAELNIDETVTEIHARTHNPVTKRALRKILLAQVGLLKERAAKYYDDDWFLVETASSFEVTTVADDGRVLCMIHKTLKTPL